MDDAVLDEGVGQHDAGVVDGDAGVGHGDVDAGALEGVGDLAVAELGRVGGGGDDVVGEDADERLDRQVAPVAQGVERRVGGRKDGDAGGSVDGVREAGDGERLDQVGQTGGGGGVRRETGQQQHRVDRVRHTVDTRDVGQHHRRRVVDVARNAKDDGDGGAVLGDLEDLRQAGAEVDVRRVAHERARELQGGQVARRHDGRDDVVVEDLQQQLGGGHGRQLGEGVVGRRKEREGGGGIVEGARNGLVAGAGDNAGKRGERRRGGRLLQNRRLRQHWQRHQRRCQEQQRHEALDLHGRTKKKKRKGERAGGYSQAVGRRTGSGRTRAGPSACVARALEEAGPWGADGCRGAVRGTYRYGEDGTTGDGGRRPTAGDPVTD